MITDQQVRAALEEHAHSDDQGRWGFGDERPWHTEASALAITRACLLLGVPVTPVLTGETWAAAITRLANIEERVTAIEARLDSGRAP